MPDSKPEILKNNSAKKSKNGGARPGAGRPKGGMNESTKIRMAAKLEFQRRVAHHADQLFHSQFDLATGEKYLMVKHVDTDDKGKRKVWVEMVTDVETIKKYIEDGGKSLNEGDDYYYMSTKPASNQALDSLLNRAFGKADENLDLTSGGEKITNYSELSDEKLTKMIESYLARRKK